MSTTFSPQWPHRACLEWCDGQQFDGGAVVSFQPVLSEGLSLQWMPVAELLAKVEVAESGPCLGERLVADLRACKDLDPQLIAVAVRMAFFLNAQRRLEDCLFLENLTRVHAKIGFVSVEEGRLKVEGGSVWKSLQVDLASYVAIEKRLIEIVSGVREAREAVEVLKKTRRSEFYVYAHRAITLLQRMQECLLKASLGCPKDHGLYYLASTGESASSDGWSQRMRDQIVEMQHAFFALGDLFKECAGGEQKELERNYFAAQGDRQEPCRFLAALRGEEASVVYVDHLPDRGSVKWMRMAPKEMALRGLLSCQEVKDLSVLPQTREQWNLLDKKTNEYVERLKRLYTSFHKGVEGKVLEQLAPAVLSFEAKLWAGIDKAWQEGDTFSLGNKSLPANAESIAHRVQMLAQTLGMIISFQGFLSEEDGRRLCQFSQFGMERLLGKEADYAFGKSETWKQIERLRQSYHDQLQVFLQVQWKDPWKPLIAQRVKGALAQEGQRWELAYLGEKGSHDSYQGLVRAAEVHGYPEGSKECLTKVRKLVEEIHHIVSQ